MRPRLVYFDQWTDPVAGTGPRGPWRRRRDAPRDHRRSVDANWAGLEARARLPVADPHRAGAQPGRRRAVDLRSRRSWNAAPTCSPCAPPARATTSSTSTRAPPPGVIVCNNSGPGREAVAEHALGFMLTLAKKISLADRMIRRETACRTAAPLRSSELLGKTLGIVGVGQIGGRLIELCAPFAMDVLAYDPYLSDDEATRARCDEGRARRAARTIRLRAAQLPVDARDRGPHRTRAVRAMKPTAFFITTARGPVHDEAALYDALVDGAIAGARHRRVPRRAARPRRTRCSSLDNVVASPHTAGITVEATRDIARRDRRAVDHDLRGQGAAPAAQPRGVARVLRPIRCTLRRAPPRSSTVTVATTKSAKVREQLDHPVIDADGHWVELFPDLLRLHRRGREPGRRRQVPARATATASTAGTSSRWRSGASDGCAGRRTGACRSTCATAPRPRLPGLFYDSLDDWGIDLAIVFPSIGLTLGRDIADPELSNVAIRAYNTMVADLFSPYLDRMVPVGVLQPRRADRGDRAAGARARARA